MRLTTIGQVHVPERYPMQLTTLGQVHVPERYSLHLITPGQVHVPEIPGSSNKSAGLQLNSSPHRWQPLIHHIAGHNPISETSDAQRPGLAIDVSYRTSGLIKVCGIGSEPETLLLKLRNNCQTIAQNSSSPSQ